MQNKPEGEEQADHKLISSFLDGPPEAREGCEIWLLQQLQVPARLAYVSRRSFV